MRNVMLSFLLVVAGLSVSSAAQNKPAKEFRIHRFFPTIVAQVGLIGQTSPIPQTTLLTSPKSGTYRLSVQLTPVVVPPNYSLNLNVFYTDDSGPEELFAIQNSSGVAGCNPGACSFITTLRNNEGMAISFSLAIQGDVTYDLFITVERLQ